MKKLLFFLIALLPVSLFAQNSIQSFFDKYEGRDGFTTVKISPKLFDLVASANIEDADMEIVKDITGLNVLVYEPGEGKSADLTEKLFTESKSLLTNGYDELLSVKDEETDIKILAKPAGNGIISDLLIVGKSDGQFVYVNVLGKMDLKKISSLSKSMDIKGMEHLKDVEEK
jgi:hypothetical protein